MPHGGLLGIPKQAQLAYLIPGPPEVTFYPFLGEGSPTKTDGGWGEGRGSLNKPLLSP